MISPSPKENQMTKTMLIVGASGVIGAPAIEHISRLPGWKVIGLSRRRPDVESGTVFEHISLDLQDAAACRAAAPRFAEVTHIVYAALFEKPDVDRVFVGADLGHHSVTRIDLYTRQQR